MENTLINFETAKLAKELGFDRKSWSEHMQTYFSHGVWYAYLYPFSDEFYYSETYKKTKDIGFALHEASPIPLYEPFYICPTQSLLQKWLREYHQRHISITYKEVEGKKIEGINSVYFDIEVYWLQGGDAWKEYKFESFSDNYEECLEKGLQEVLKKLIEYKKK